MREWGDPPPLWPKIEERSEREFNLFVVQNFISWKKNVGPNAWPNCTIFLTHRYIYTYVNKNQISFSHIWKNNMPKFLLSPNLCANYKNTLNRNYGSLQ